MGKAPALRAGLWKVLLQCGLIKLTQILPQIEETYKKKFTTKYPWGLPFDHHTVSQTFGIIDHKLIFITLDCTQIRHRKSTTLGFSAPHSSVCCTCKDVSLGIKFDILLGNLSDLSKYIQWHVNEHLMSKQKYMPLH